MHPARRAGAPGTLEHQEALMQTLSMARANGAAVVAKLEAAADQVEEEIRQLESRLWNLRTSRAKKAWGDSPIRSPKSGGGGNWSK